MAVAAASASHLGWGAIGHVVAHNPAAHIPSGSISVGPHGATVAGPAGSVSTNNGVHGHAGAVVAGPSGTVSGWGAHGAVEGPAGSAGHGWGHGGNWGHGGWGVGRYAGHVAPVAIVAPTAVSWGGHGGWGHGAWGHGGWGHGAVVVGHGHGHGW